MRHRYCGLVLLPLAGISFVLGCGPSRPDWMIPPPLDPPTLTQAILKQADSNGDGLLAGKELSAIPALMSAVKTLDRNGDKALSAAEIEAWLTAIKSEDLAFYEAPLLVTQFGRGVEQATVRLIPEGCMGPGAEAAHGITVGGFTSLTSEGGKTFGVRAGLYRVQVTGKGADGNSIPAKYNTATTFGLAIGGGLPQPRTSEFKID